MNLQKLIGVRKRVLRSTKTILAMTLLAIATSLAVIDDARANPTGSNSFDPNKLPSWLTTIPIEQINIGDLFGGNAPPAGLFDPSKTPTNTTTNGIGANKPSDSDTVELIKPINQQPINEPLSQSVGDQKCASWNSFISPAIHVLELSQFDAEIKTISYFLYDQEGGLIGSGSAKLPPAREKDIVLNDLIEKFPNQIGTICTTGANSISGRVSVYKKSSLDSDAIEFNATWPLSTGSKGTQYISLNTFFPSRTESQSDFVVSNWLELTNLEHSTITGKLSIFSQDGTLIEQSILSIAPLSRLDIPGHIIEKNSIGSALWEPNEAQHSVLLNSSRYYYNNSSFENTLAAATVDNASLDANTFTTVNDSSTNNSSVLELSNGSKQISQLEITVTTKDNLSESFNISLLGLESRHFMISDIADRGSIITVSSSNKFAAHTLNYTYNQNNELVSVASHGKLQQSRATLSSSYNTHLDLQCSLRIFNHSETSAIFKVTMLRDSGKILLGEDFKAFSQTFLNGEPYNISANSYRDIDICQHEEINQVGLLTVFSEPADLDFSAVLIKQNASLSSSDYIELSSQ